MTDNTTRDDDLSIPDFLLLDPIELVEAYRKVKRQRQRQRQRQRKIDYPRDGYKCKGLRSAQRAKHRERLRRRAERMRQPTGRRK